MHNETLISDFADFSVLGEFPNKICIKIILCHFNLLWPVFNLPVSFVSCHKKLGLNWYLSTILIFSFYYKVTKTVSIMQILKPVLLIKQIHNARILIWATMRKISLFFHKLKFSNIALSLHPYSVNLWHFKLRIFDLTEFIVWNIKGLKHRVPNI